MEESKLKCSIKSQEISSLCESCVENSCVLNSIVARKHKEQLLKALESNKRTKINN